MASNPVPVWPQDLFEHPTRVSNVSRQGRNSNPATQAPLTSPPQAPNDRPTRNQPHGVEHSSVSGGNTTPVLSAPPSTAGPGPSAYAPSRPACGRTRPDRLAEGPSRPRPISEGAVGLDGLPRPRRDPGHPWDVARVPHAGYGSGQPTRANHPQTITSYRCTARHTPSSPPT